MPRYPGNPHKPVFDPARRPELSGSDLEKRIAYMKQMLDFGMSTQFSKSADGERVQHFLEIILMVVDDFESRLKVLERRP